MKTWIKLALLALAGIVVTQLLVQRSPPPIGDGRPAPPLALPDLAGRTVDLASLRGKVVAVNFWASWCGPCQMEIPELADAWREHRDRCFEILGVAEESARADVIATAERIPYPVLFDGDAAALGAWDVRGYPRTYIVDPEGKIRHVIEGALAKRELEDAIRPLLPASCPRS
jgi:cytochrome c biogenesis protein CcmG, thiol:disulfide interchange protein DsbE